MKTKKQVTEAIKDLRARLKATKGGAITVSQFYKEPVIHVQVQGWFSAEETRIIADFLKERDLVMQTSNMTCSHEFGLLIFKVE